jgi:hypothetical protein
MLWDDKHDEFQSSALHLGWVNPFTLGADRMVVSKRPVDEVASWSGLPWLSGDFLC